MNWLAIRSSEELKQFQEDWRDLSGAEQRGILDEMLQELEKFEVKIKMGRQVDKKHSLKPRRRARRPRR